MSVSALVYPMLAMVLLTFAVLVTLFRARMRALREGLIPASYFRTFQGHSEPEYTLKPARQLVNLFEAPVLFYVACLAAMATSAVTISLVLLAWGYVAARLAQALIHLGGNRVRLRLRAYFLSWLFLLALWANLTVMIALRH